MIQQSGAESLITSNNAKTLQVTKWRPYIVVFIDWVRCFPFTACIYLFLSDRIRISGETATPRAWRLTDAIWTTKSTAAPHHLDRFLPTKGCNSHVNLCTPTANNAKFNEVRTHTEKVYTRIFETFDIYNRPVILILLHDAYLHNLSTVQLKIVLHNQSQ